MIDDGANSRAYSRIFGTRVVPGTVKAEAASEDVMTDNAMDVSKFKDVTETGRTKMSGPRIGVVGESVRPEELATLAATDNRGWNDMARGVSNERLERAAAGLAMLSVQAGMLSAYFKRRASVPHHKAVKQANRVARRISKRLGVKGVYRELDRETI